MSGVHTSAEDHNLKLVTAAFERWKAGAGSAFDLLAPDAKWTIVGNSGFRRHIKPSRSSWTRSFCRLMHE